MDTVQIGQRVYWHDPDRDEPCSGNGTVVSIGVDDGDPIVPDETIIGLQMDAGGEAEVLLQELDSPQMPHGRSPNRLSAV